jgi:hypothetical protein
MVRTFGSMGQDFVVFQAFSLRKLQNLRLLSQKLKFWESLNILIIPRQFRIQTVTPYTIMSYENDIFCHFWLILYVAKG